MKKKVVLAVAFVLLVLSSVVLSSNSADAKTYKRKLIDNWEFKNVKCFPEDDLYLKTGKKSGFTFSTDYPDTINVDKKGHVTFKTIGNATVTATSPDGRSYRCLIKIRPHVFEAEDITVKVGETFAPKLNVGDAVLPKDFYYNIGLAFLRDYFQENKVNNGLTNTLTALKPCEVDLTLQWTDMECSFRVTVVE